MDQGAMYDAADAELQQANHDAEERAIALIRFALDHGADEGDAIAACWCAGLKWNDVKPQRRAA